jgi:cbb3-type cytochrome oxidase subunit 3
MTFLNKLRISQLLGAAFSICFVAILAIAVAAGARKAAAATPVFP